MSNFMPLFCFRCLLLRTPLIYKPTNQFFSEIENIIRMKLQPKLKMLKDTTSDIDHRYLLQREFKNIETQTRTLYKKYLHWFTTSL